MVKIRLRRVGAKKQPHYRVVVTDSRSPRDGRFIETIGYYNPRTEPPTVEIDAERALHWLSVGAQPTAAVERMLDKMGILSQVAAVRRGEVSVEGLASQIGPAKVGAKAPKVEAEPARAEEEEEEIEVETDWVEIEEEEEATDWLEIGEEEEEADWDELEEADWDEAEEEEDETTEAEDDEFDEPEDEQANDVDEDEFTEDDE